MWKFNSEILPAANFRASSLWKDIRKKKPGFELTPGVFYDGISNYSILVQQLPPETNDLIDITIYDYTESNRQQVVIKATHGELKPAVNGERVDLVLKDGEMHRIVPPRSRDNAPRYERLAFGEHRLTLDLSELSFERSDPDNGYRSDRTMPSRIMIRYVDSLETSMAANRRQLADSGLKWLADSTFAAPTDLAPSMPDPADTTDVYPARRLALEGLTKKQQMQAYESALNLLRGARPIGRYVFGRTVGRFLMTKLNHSHLSEPLA
jgi:lipopolysaccharide export system permease protein